MVLKETESRFAEVKRLAGVVVHVNRVPVIQLTQDMLLVHDFEIYCGKT